MTSSELKYRHETNNPGSYFFTRNNMKFAGDTMKNYGVRESVVATNYDNNGDYTESGIVIECWELYRLQPVKFGLQKSVYFDKITFKVVK